ncbi:MAG TPA: VWA domain-containing protein, partial [Myxococcales bacterium]|nr:VWA domain-containing protein [Myxococcales bacterium]
MLKAAAAGALLCVLAACTDAQLGVPAPPALQALDDRLEIDGSYCTQPAGAAVFPVKIVFLIDLSNSMCYTDPASGACTTDACDQGPNSPATNPQPPKRLQAVQAVINRFANNPAVSYSVVTFSSFVHVYPFDNSPPTNPVYFTRDTTQLN